MHKETFSLSYYIRNIFCVILFACIHSKQKITVAQYFYLEYHMTAICGKRRGGGGEGPNYSCKIYIYKCVLSLCFRLLVSRRVGQFTLVQVDTSWGD